MSRRRKHVWMQIDVDGEPAMIKASPDIDSETIAALNAAIRAGRAMLEAQTRSDMKPTSITVSFGRTQSLREYSNIKPAITLSADLEDGDDPEACRAELLEQARTFVEEQIDLALEADGTPAKFSTAPRYKILHVTDRWIGGAFRGERRIAP